MTFTQLSILETAVNDYFTAEEEFKLFLTTWVGGWWENKTAKQREDYTKHNERTSCKWDTIIQMCKLLDIDSTAFFATVKANNRYTRNHGKWDRYADINRLTYWQKDNFLELITNDSEKLHYQSTGRKKSA